MEFWGVEVKPNESLKITVEDLKLLHISQVALGEVKSGKKVENVPVRVHINNKKFVVGTLSSERAPQIIFDLVFEQDLELSHGWKDGSVYFCGYIADNQVEDDDGYDFDMDEEEEMSFNANGRLQAKPMETLKELAKEDYSDEDDDSEDDDDSDEEDESEEEKDVKPVKRPAQSAPKTPVPAKKAKTETPQKTDGKKGPSSKPNFKKAKKSGGK